MKDKYRFLWSEKDVLTVDYCHASILWMIILE